MKKIALSTLIILLLNCLSYGQDRIKIGYRLKDASSSIVVNLATDVTTLGINYTLNNNVYFNIVKDVSIVSNNKKYYLINIPGKKSNSNNNANLAPVSLKIIGNDEFGMSFWIPAENIDAGKINEIFNVEYSISRVSVSVLSVPFKYRFGENGINEFTTDGTIGTSIGFKIYNNRLFDYGLSLNIGGGITTFNRTIIDKNDNTKTTKQNIAGFSLVPALVFNVGKVQMGLAFGWDFSDVEPKWDYNAKPWLSFSVGYSFLEPFKANNN